MLRSVIFICLLLAGLNVFCQISAPFDTEMAYPEKLDSFLRTNKGIALYFHTPNNLIVRESMISSWDWNNGIIYFSEALTLEFATLKYPSIRQYREKIEPILFTICLDSSVVTHVQAQTDSQHTTITLPYVKSSEMDDGQQALKLYPSNLEYQSLLRACTDRRDELIAKSQESPDDRLITLLVFQNNALLCTDLIISYAMLYDPHLKKHLIDRKLLEHY